MCSRSVRRPPVQPGATSAADVHAAVDALEAGDTEVVALAYERLLVFWSELAAVERHG